MKVFIVLCCFFIAAYGASNVDDDSWKTFKQNHKKKYSSDDDETRHRAIWKANVAKIEQHNLEADSNPDKVTYKMGINQFTDMTYEEFKETSLGATPPNDTVAIQNDQQSLSRRVSRQMPPASLDLRQRGEVNAVRNQGQCGSCWTFSATASVESCYYRKWAQPIDLSEQQLLDCVYSRSGCNGGWATDAFYWLKQYGGQTKENFYPYTGYYSGWCQRPSSYFKATGFVQIPNNVYSIKNALAQYGVLAIAVDGNQWANYKSGIFYTNYVGQPNHAVNLVGYGTTNGIEYWIVRNSWGTGWGENGYIRLNIAAGIYNTYYTQTTYAVTC